MKTKTNSVTKKTKPELLEICRPSLPLRLFYFFNIEIRFAYSISLNFDFWQENGDFYESANEEVNCMCSNSGFLSKPSIWSDSQEHSRHLENQHKDSGL